MEAFWVVAVERWQRMANRLLEAAARSAALRSEGRWEGLVRNLLEEAAARPLFWSRRARWARHSDAARDLAQGALQLQ